MTSTAPTATGRRAIRAGTSAIVFTRTFATTITEIWAAVTEPERLARWIGTWTGNPADGEVTFLMNAEGDEIEPETYRIETCDPPRRLITRTFTREQPNFLWRLTLELAESTGITTLTFAQDLTDADLAAKVGPGWDYYLDRLVAAESGADVGPLHFNDYYPALAEHYRSMFR